MASSAQDVHIGAMFPPDGLLHTAVNAGLTGATPSAAMRYLAYLAAGLSPDEARNKIMPSRTPLSAFDGRSAMERVRIPQDILDDIRKRHPGKQVSWTLRYYMALVNGANERQAESIADGFKSGRPPGSRDSYQRTRRSRAEISAASETETT